MDQLRYKTPDHPRIPVDGLAGRDGFPYVPDPRLIAAANAALVLDMPLLLTGEAGCGKTDFAWAVASALGDDTRADDHTRVPLECYVRSDSLARDLLYHYDAIQRFGDAQHGGEEGRRRAGDPRNYIRLRPLGEALMSSHLRVVLIDEIDKAPRDLPNDLLRELGQGRFEIPEIADDKDEVALSVNVNAPSTFRRTMVRPDPNQRPLVIITSNVERQLPDPFLRRCLFFHIPFPGEEALRRIVSARVDSSPPYIDQALEIFGRLREATTLAKRPTTSELISWVGALGTLFDQRDVSSLLTAFTESHDDLSKVAVAALPWKTLPALSCLVKLREDLDRLHAIG